MNILIPSSIPQSIAPALFAYHEYTSRRSSPLVVSTGSVRYFQNIYDRPFVFRDFQLIVSTFSLTDAQRKQKKMNRKSQQKAARKKKEPLKKERRKDDAFVLLGRLSKERFLFLLFISIIKISLSSLFSFSRWNSICADNPLFSARNKEFKYFLPFVIRVFRFSLSFFAAFSKWREGYRREILKLNYFVSEHKKKANPKGDSKSISHCKKGPFGNFFVGLFLFCLFLCVRVCL